MPYTTPCVCGPPNCYEVILSHYCVNILEYMIWQDREVNLNITLQLVYTHKFPITYNQNFMLIMEYLTPTHHVESCNASHCKTFVSQKSLYIQYLSKFVAGGNKAQIFS